MNSKRFQRWPSPLNLAVHLQRTDEILAKTSRPVLLSDWKNRRAFEVRSLSQRKAFIVSRGLVCRALSVALECAPDAAPILRQANGKPGILGSGIQFNVSHCEDWFAVGWSAESPVGVVVEVIRPVQNMEEIVNNFLPPIAQRAFRAAQTKNKTQVFFHWWAQIEAALKASGRGLDDSYDCLDDVRHEVCEAVPGVALAVAVVGTGPLTVTWHLP